MRTMREQTAATIHVGVNSSVASSPTASAMVSACAAERGGGKLGACETGVGREGAAPRRVIYYCSR
jgi:hypothetical protein